MITKYLTKFFVFVFVALLITLPILAKVSYADNPKQFNPKDTAEGVISQDTDAGTVINTVIKYITYILTGLFVLMVLIGAIMYMVYPDTERKQKGMTLIQGAILAGVLAILSYAIWKIMTDVLVNN